MVEVSKIKPDPKQPRKYFSKESIEELAASIKEHGVIKNIEIDKDFLIVTGENRWRAAKKAGLHKVPCRIVDLNDDSRFERQIHENVHHTPMSSWDLAMALKKYRDAGESLISIGERFKKTREWVREYLDFFEISPRLQNELKKIPTLNSKVVSAIQRLSEMELSGKIETGTCEAFLASMQRSDHFNPMKVKYCAERVSLYPDRCKEILQMVFSKESTSEFLAELDTHFPQKPKNGALAHIIFTNKLITHIKQATATIALVETHWKGQAPEELRKAMLKLQKETQKSLKLLPPPK